MPVINPIAPGSNISKGELVEPGVYKLNLGKLSDGSDQIQYTDSNGNGINYTPVMQSTSQTDRKDANLGTKIDNISGTNAATTAMQNATNGATGGTTGQNSVNPDGTPKTPYKSPDGVYDVSETPISGQYVYKTPATLQDGEKVGYGADGKRYIIGKDGSTRNDAFADQEYSENESYIAKQKEREELFTSLKTNLDNAHATLLDSIAKTFATRRAKEEDINARYLALKQNEGFSGLTARYMSDINNGVLKNEEEEGNARLADIDAKEKELVAQAVQAKSDKDYEIAFKKMDEFDQLQKQKTDTIQAVYKAAQDYNKMLDDQDKELRAAEKEKFAKAKDTLDISAPALLKGYDAIKNEKAKNDYIVALAKKLGVDESIVSGTIEGARSKATADEALINSRNRSNQPKTVDDGTTTDPSTKDTVLTPEETKKVEATQSFFTSVDKKIADQVKDGDVPIVTSKGFLTYAAFKELLSAAQRLGIDRATVISRYQGKLNLTHLGRIQSGYGLTDEELDELRKNN